jgi:hypothetical protein
MQTAPTGMERSVKAYSLVSVFASVSALVNTSLPRLHHILCGIRA